MSSILVLSAHRTPDQSRINKAQVAALREVPGITVHELMREYPDYKIDVAREHELLKNHQHIVMMFPFFWYSSPAILKEWEDAVLTYGFAYGTNGTALQGKTLQVIVSTGGDEKAYTPEGYNRYPAKDQLLPFHAVANRTGMDWLEPLLIQGANNMTDEQVPHHVERTLALLKSQLSSRWLWATAL